MKALAIVFLLRLGYGPVFFLGAPPPWHGPDVRPVATFTWSFR